MVEAIPCGDLNMPEEQPDYLSYLLRLWRERSEGGLEEETSAAVWHASLESSLTGQRMGFCSVDALCTYLRRETGLADEKAGEECTERP
jgi:hypothetical protein